MFIIACQSAQEKTRSIAKEKDIGRVATVCSRYDSSWNILVAGDWRRAEIIPSSEFGLLHCEEEKDALRVCQGPQVPDAGFTVTFTRSGENISAHLIGETKGGQRDFAQLECFHLATGEPVPRDLKTWAVEYGETGGIADLNRHLRLVQTGELEVSANSENFASHVTASAPADLVAKIDDFLKNAQQERPGSAGPMPDAINTSLALISAGSKYELEIPEKIGNALNQTVESVLTKALVGSWWESRWDLCHPKPQLTGEQMDPPVERLIFRDDGRFSVTWQGGGARAYEDRTGKIPHAAIPDYSGRYDIQPDHGRIHLSFESGIYNPRDFSGEGFFQITGDKLVLRGVWLGTYKAKQKPDICELTFERASAPWGKSAQQME